MVVQYYSKEASPLVDLAMMRRALLCLQFDIEIPRLIF